MSGISPEQIKQFQRRILLWYAVNKRDLPWRKTRDPYHILISEVMAQQTQLSRVVPKYLTWLTVFPTVKSLAKASTRDVLTFWSGLGYNRRALYLQKTTKEIMERYAGKFPKDLPTLQTLPGIGEYTAKAIACFAFNEQVAVVDTNVRRVILTQFQISNPPLTAGRQDVKSQIPTEKEVREIAEKILPVGYAYEWNQALMDYSAAELKKEKIPIPKQSKFKGSDRYYRGQIVRLLIEKKQLSNEEVFEKLKKQEGFGKERFEKIVGRLIKDRLVILEKQVLKIS